MRNHFQGNKKCGVCRQVVAKAGFTVFVYGITLFFHFLQRILTMEFVKGHKVSEKEKLQEDGFSLAEVRK